jgi:hypothetical protein
MPQVPAQPVPLDRIRLAARLYIAEHGYSQTNLYLEVQPLIYAKGEVIQPTRGGYIVGQPSVLVFADDAPRRNWGHPCRYLRHDPIGGQILQVIPAIVPPVMNFGATFKSFHCPTAPTVARTATYDLVLSPPVQFATQASDWYAILYSGASNNRHVNDLEFLYRTLVHTYLVPQRNIFVLNYDGTLCYDDDGGVRTQDPIGNWPGNNTPYEINGNIWRPGQSGALLEALAAFNTSHGGQGRLLLYTTNHGFRFNGVSTLSSYGEPDMDPTRLAGALRALNPFAALMVVMQQCYAGGFQDELVATAPATWTSVTVAVNAVSESSGGPGDNFDPFSCQWISAMAGEYPNGTTLRENPDSTGNGVSANDACAFAKKFGSPNDCPTIKCNTAAAGDVKLSDGRAVRTIAMNDRLIVPAITPSLKSIGS